MADYLADPLWYRGPHGTGEYMISLDRLPLSAELKGRLRAWADRFDALMHTDYEFPSDADEAAWIADGRALLGPVQEELGPDYDVDYFHEGAAPEGRQ